MIRRKRHSAISIAILVAVFLCFSGGTKKNLYALCCGPDLGDISYTAGDMLERNLLYVLDRTLPIISTSFVNLDNLRETSAFGRLIGEQIASRFSQHGYKVIELRLSNGEVVIKERNGELVLSRDMKKINKCQDAQAIIVGTYCIAENRAFLSTRLVSTLDNSILSSYNFSIRMDALLKTLAKKNLNNAAKGKKPEKHFRQGGKWGGGDKIGMQCSQIKLIPYQTDQFFLNCQIRLQPKLCNLNCPGLDITPPRLTESGRNTLVRRLSPSRRPRGCRM